MSRALPIRFQLGEIVSVLSSKPVRDFTGPVVGVYFKNDGIVYYDVRDAGGNVVLHIDQLHIHHIDHYRIPRSTRAQRDATTKRIEG